MYAIIAKNEKDLLEFAKKKGFKIIPLDKDSIIEPAKFEDEKSNVKVHEFLAYLGIRPHIKGYDYLKFIFENELDCNDSITTVLYPKIAEHFNTTPSSVERAIRHAIETAIYSSTVAELYTKMFGPFDEHPSNHQFLKGVQIYLSKL